MILKNDNKPLLLFHGTNRKFANHSMDKSRTELNDRFQGDWICYTPSEDVAWKYANAARNQCIDKDFFLQDTASYLDKNFPDKTLNDFLIKSFEILMNNSFDNSWDIISNKYSEIFGINIEKATKHFFDRLRTYERLNSDFDFNDFYDVLEYVEYSKYGSVDETDSVLNMFSTSIKEIPEHVINFLKSKNFEHTLPETKVIKSFVEAKNILETESRDKAKKAKKNGYDLVIYSGPDCVDGVAEYLIANNSQIKMDSMKIAHKKIEYIDENETEWFENVTYENIDLDKQLKSKKRMRF